MSSQPEPLEFESIRKIADRLGIHASGEDVDILTGKRVAEEPRDVAS